MIVLNFKSYREVSGVRAVKAARIAEKISRKAKVRIMVSPQPVDMFLVKTKTKAEVISQHVDPVIEGRGTGKISFYSLYSLGIKYAMLNHSERKIPFKEIEKTVKMAKKLGFKLLLLADSIREAKALVRLKPWAIGLEPPELIATGKSISKTKPKTLEKFVKIVERESPKSIIFCGAGISSLEDVEKALELGAQGVLVASAFDKAKNKEKVLKNLVKPFSNF